LNIQNKKHEARIYRLKPISKSKLLQLEDYTKEELVTFRLGIEDLNAKTFKNLLELLNIDLIYVDHLIHYPTYKFMKLIQQSGVKYIFDIHDFYSVCPSYNLINSQGVFCGAETNVNVCQDCLMICKPKMMVDIWNWRKRFQFFLENAYEIISPSEHTKKLILKYYPHLKITVKDRKIPDTIKYTFDPQFALQESLNVAFIGSISKVKGSKIIYELLSLIRKDNLPVNIKVIGVTNVRGNPFLSEDKRFELTGRYNNGEISNLLARYKISLVVVPSICPETYSWAASEAMWSGYPVVTFNIGAPADRVRRKDGGWVLEEVGCKSIYDLLNRLVKSRNEILEKAANLK